MDFLNHKKYKQTVSLITILFFPTMVTAYNLHESLRHGQGVVQLGGYWDIQAQADHVNINGLIGDDFSAATPKIGSSGLFGVGYFIDGFHKSWLNTTIGLNWFYLGPIGKNGTVTQENLYTNLGYRYTITNYPLYAIAQSTLKTPSPKFDVTIDAGVGPNFIQTKSFSEQSLDSITIPDQIFAGKTTTVFSATAGIGIKFNHVLGDYPLELGYRFFYLGQGRFSALSNQVNSILTTGQGYANAAVCTFRI